VNAEELWSRLAIQDLTNRYALYVDTKQLDRLIDLFWADAIFDESALGAGPFRAQAAIREYFRKNPACSNQLSAGLYCGCPVNRQRDPRRPFGEAREA